MGEPVPDLGPQPLHPQMRVRTGQIVFLGPALCVGVLNTDSATNIKVIWKPVLQPIANALAVLMAHDSPVSWWKEPNKQKRQ